MYISAIQHFVLIVEMALITFIARRGYRQVESPLLNKTGASSDSKQTGGIDNIAATYGSLNDL